MAPTTKAGHVQRKRGHRIVPLISNCSIFVERAVGSDLRTVERFLLFLQKIHVVPSNQSQEITTQILSGYKALICGV